MLTYLDVEPGQEMAVRVRLMQQADRDAPVCIGVHESHDVRRSVLAMVCDAEQAGAMPEDICIRSLEGGVVRPPGSGGQLAEAAEKIWREKCGQTVLGYRFRPFTKNDNDGYAGAEPGSLICHDAPGRVLIWHPATQTLSEIMADGPDQRQWDYKQSLVHP